MVKLLKERVAYTENCISELPADEAGAALTITI